MEFRLLGPVAIHVDGRAVNAGLRQQRFVLAVLALQVNRLVSTERLMDLIWPDGPPATARRVIHSQVSQLRATLTRAGAARDRVAIRSEATGYVLACDPDHVDAHRFTALVERLPHVSDHQARTELLTEALGMWQGAALAGTVPEPTREVLCGHLEEARLVLSAERLDSQLQLGGHEAVIAEAVRLSAEHPYRHHFTATLMRALNQAGRTAEAVTVYQRAKDRFADQLGLDPPAELVDAHASILSSTAEPAATEQVVLPATRCDLPRTVSHFTGRADELDFLMAVSPDLQSTVVITAVDGMAGIGKTALAVHTAHRLAERYPDAQLYLDLHGHTPDQEPLTPGAALGKLLRAVNVPGERIPADPQERSALWRAQLSGRAAVLVLDNVADAAQIRPLLPGSADCLVLVTSRQRLTDLDGSRVLSLDVLTPADALALFTHAVGDNRAAAEPDAVAEILRLCGYLPLAIRIAAARLRHRRTWSIATLLVRLRDQRRRLSELEAEDRGVATTFALSYEQLSPDHRRFFRLLSLIPGPDFDVYPAAALAGTDEVTQFLEDLLDMHLLQQPSADRYHFHDLLRDYATRLAQTEETEAERHAAKTRLLDYYLHTASVAVNVILGEDKPGWPAVSGAPGPLVADYDRAMAWMETERANLLAAAAHTAAHGWATHTNQLATVLRKYLQVRGHQDDETSLDAVHGARIHEGYALCHLGLGRIWLAQYEDAVTHLEQAAAIGRDTGDRVLEGYALCHLGLAFSWFGRCQDAVACLDEALAIGRVTATRGLEGYALCHLGLVHCWLGRYREATRCLERSLAIGRETAVRGLEGLAICHLGFVHLRQGRLAEATAALRTALAIGRSTGTRSLEGFALCNLGLVHIAQGDYHEAASVLGESLAIGQETGTRNLEGLSLCHLGLISLRQGRLAEATATLHSALTIGQETRTTTLLVMSFNNLGEAAHHADNPALALDYLHRALAVTAQSGELPEQAVTHDHLARVLHDNGHLPEASHHRDQACALRAALDAPAPAAD
jgi:DNA-binding SARP family transcriptional activator/tetratricopeptide (TPR) repeat protein